MMDKIKIAIFFKLEQSSLEHSFAVKTENMD